MSLKVWLILWSVFALGLLAYPLISWIGGWQLVLAVLLATLACICGYDYVSTPVTDE